MCPLRRTQSRSISVTGGRTAGFGFEKIGKIILILKPEIQGDGFYFHGGCGQQFLCRLDFQIGNEILRGFSGIMPEGRPEGPVAHTERPGQIGEADGLIAVVHDIIDGLPDGGPGSVGTGKFRIL